MSCTVGVALILLLDASGSIEPADWERQVEATAEALAGEAVGRIVETGGGVAVRAIGFTERATPMTPWHLLRAAPDAARYAAVLAAAPRPEGYLTDIALALSTALDAFAAVPCDPERRVVDLSTDGVSSVGGPTGAQRDRAEAEGVTVNAIGVGDRVPGWLRDNAVTRGGFAVESATWDDYAAGLRRKLKLELSAR